MVILEKIPQGQTWGIVPVCVVLGCPGQQHEIAGHLIGCNHPVCLGSLTQRKNTIERRPDPTSTDLFQAPLKILWVTSIDPRSFF